MEAEIINKCRICLQNSKKCFYIFDKFDQDLSLQEIFEETTGFQMDNDSMPAYMCNQCSSILIDFYNLKLLYQENERKLKEKEENAIIIQVAEEESCSEPSQGVSEEDDNMDSETYSCPECGECFQEDDFVAHLQNKHGGCSIESTKIQSMTVFNVETLKKEITCKYCKLRFQSNEEYKQHLECHKNNICDICGLGFSKKAYLRDHQDVHYSEKRHVCNFCNKAFKRRTVLVKHKRIHTHPRQCICESCGKAFNDNGTLQTHIKLVHLKEKNYMCLLCGDKFSLKGTLDKHIKRHENRKREFACNQCPLTYRDKSSLDRHINMKHTGKVEKHNCEVCGKNYSCVGNLYKHLRMCHSAV